MVSPFIRGLSDEINIRPLSLKNGVDLLIYKFFKNLCEDNFLYLVTFVLLARIKFTAYLGKTQV